jgi:hypothetical protein
MRIAVLGPVPYSDVVEMTHQERVLLTEVLQERIDAQTPNNTQRQTGPNNSK